MLKVTTNETAQKILFSIDYLGNSQELYFKGSRLNTASLGDAAFCAFLPIAMNKGLSLSIDRSVSKQLAMNSQTIQSIYSTWFNDMTTVDTNLKQHNAAKRGSKVASFFSCGIDSLDTLLSHFEEIDYLVYVEGYDVWPHEKSYLKFMRQKIREAGKLYKKEVIFITTNLHLELDTHIRWGDQYHGAALATVAHLLPAEIGKVYIPSTYTYSSLLPWGSHPILDPLWSSSSLQIVHDGANKPRAEKTLNVYSDRMNIAPNIVRVCLGDRTTGRHNCSECEKCARTMLVIDLLNFKNKAKTFDFKKHKNFKALTDAMGDLPLVLMRTGETIQYFRKGQVTYDSDKLAVLESKFQDMTKTGFSGAYYDSYDRFIPTDLIYRAKLSDHIKEAAVGHKDNLIDKTKKTKALIVSCKSLAIALYSSQNIVRLKHVKKLFKKHQD